MKLKHYLNEAEEAKVIAFCNDETMREAVKKVLFEGITQVGLASEGITLDNRNWAYNLGGYNDFAMDNEKVGALLKAVTKGIGFMEDAFKRLEEFKSPAKQEEDNNPAL